MLSSTCLSFSEVLHKESDPLLQPALHSHQNTVIFYNHLVRNTDTGDSTSAENGLRFSEFYGAVTENKDTSVASKHALEFIQVNFHLRQRESSLPTSFSWLRWTFKANCTSNCKIMPSNYMICFLSGIMFINLRSAPTSWWQYKQHVRKVTSRQSPKCLESMTRKSGSQLSISKNSVNTD